MEQPIQSGSDDEPESNNDLNEPVNQSQQQDGQEITGYNSSSEAGQSQSSLVGSNNEPRSRSRSPKDSTNPNWKSANAFINYMHDYKQKHLEYPEKTSGSNLFRLAGEKWRLMSQEEKQPYIEGAAWVRKQKASNSRNGKVKTTVRWKRSEKDKKDDSSSSNTTKNQDTKKKGRKRKKQPGIYVQVTDSDEESNSDENKSSDVSS
ncbi:high mobility group B protein 2-like [Chelonus insularis]|uniref:high mobility group B protein 2-like n=1 Tax=Chelonus insularis TaxID=460826 RepID=UPI00158DA447|nr:high mobility group B protein 2-like [Chelonus insularis]